MCCLPKIVKSQWDLHYTDFAIFAGQPNIWLDDLYVDRDARGQGAGTLLMMHLAEITQENNCTHLA